MKKILTALLLLSLPLTAEITTRDIQNEFLKVSGDIESGRFFIKTTGGDPGLETDKNKSLLYEDRTPTTFITVRIDGQDFIFGDTEAGNFSTRMNVRDNALVAVWSVHNIEVSLLLEFVDGPNTGRPDSVKISCMAMNKDYSEHKIGIRIMLDTILGKNDGAPFRIPGKGAFSTETCFSNADVPDYWYAFDDLANPTIRAQGTFKAFGLTPPNRIVFASFARFAKNLWDFEVMENRSFKRNVQDTLDSAMAAFWDPVPVESGGKTGVSTMYGLYGATIIKDIFNLSLGGPASSSGEPVTITADIQKTTPYAATNVRLSLSLPEGLAMYDDDTAEKTLGAILENSTVHKVEWNVIPGMNVKGPLTYGVVLSAMIDEKEYKVSATRSITIEELLEPPPDLPQPKTNRPPEIKVVTPETVKIMINRRYFFDFNRMNRVLADINSDWDRTAALLKSINELINARTKPYDPGMKQAHDSEITNIRRSITAYTNKTREAGKNIINVNYITNKTP